ncbi:DEAD/DEAH box helicase family protein [Nocardia sp. NPDC047038]|uniref:DEAD/DEAH box helicase family protein n=1 Tax=Nocardia sp. NPDC047038 TaxID=3154338 RepID=UPI0033D8E16E
MAKQVAAVGPTGIRVGQRLRHLRQSSGRTLDWVSTRLGELGRPIDLSALAKLEKGQRRVDVDDLVALALALDVSPNWLLLPMDATDDRVDLTTVFNAPAEEIWAWAVRDQPTGIRPNAGVVNEPSPKQSNFWFLQAEWPDLYDQAARAEYHANVDPRISCFYSRSALEMTLRWLYRHLGSDQEPKSATLSAMISDPAISDTLGPLTAKAKNIIRHGKAAVHSSRMLSRSDALACVTELYNILKLFAGMFSSHADSLPGEECNFDPRATIPTGFIEDRTSQVSGQGDARRVSAALGISEDVSERVHYVSLDMDVDLPIEEEKRSGGELASRAVFEMLLEETGWADGPSLSRDYPLTRPQGSGRLFADYVLWDDNRRPLALVEAREAGSDLQSTFSQLRAYAREFEYKFGLLPYLFGVIGSDLLVWDEVSFSPRLIKGFYTKEELGRKITNRLNRRSLNQVPIEERIVTRDHQKRIVHDVCEAFEGHNGRRRALVSMAVGSGKTATCAALVDRLVRAGWANRALFVTDRQARVDQALDVFKAHLPDLIVSDSARGHDPNAHLFVVPLHKLASYIDPNGESSLRRYGHGFFDLIFIDELVSVGSRACRRIMDYFDGLVVGFTSCPTESLDEDIKILFDISEDTPTSSYGFYEAVADGYLVEPEFTSVRITSGLNSQDSVTGKLGGEEAIDASLRILMERGAYAADGKLGKTIIFAQNVSHAQLVARRFRIKYPDLGGDFALPVTSRIINVSNIIERFKDAQSVPRVAISSGMLDMGFDVPELVNLVFLKKVTSKGLFWLMLSRGARPVKSVHGDGWRKESFRVFDFGDNGEHLR